MSWGADEAKIIREMIFKENEYMHYRITWLVTLQGFLFAALGFAWKDGRELIVALAFIGICVSLAAEPPLRFSHQAIIDLNKKWKKESPDYQGPDVVGHIDELSLKERFRSLISLWYTLPRLFVTAWISIFVCFLSNLGLFSWVWLLLIVPLLFIVAWLFGPSCLLCSEWFRTRSGAAP